MLSKIEQVEMLIALDKGDKYRLTHIRESLERGKDLFISDKNFLQDLVKTHLGDKIYQARIVSISEKSNLFCEECGSEISADEKFCTSCGTEKPEPEIKQETESIEEQTSGGFAFTADGDIGESSTRETAREGLTRKITELETKLDEQAKATRKTTRITLKPESKKKSKQEELEEYENKYLKESATKVTWKAYDVKAKRKVEIQNPKAVKMKNGKWAVKGISPITGIKVFRIVGSEKPAVSAEKIPDSPKVEKEQTAPAEKTKASPKPSKEVFSRYYRPSEAESPKPKKSKSKKSKSKKPNLFCEECGSKIATKDMFCTNCGAKR